jgi:hypothetical protein
MLRKGRTRCPAENFLIVIVWGRRVETRPTDAQSAAIVQLGKGKPATRNVTDFEDGGIEVMSPSRDPKEHALLLEISVEEADPRFGEFF